VTKRGDITLSQLRYFMVAATEGTVTGAAQQLAIAQSAVSTAIQALEAQLGAQLFVRRHARGLVLTAAGEQLLKDARWVLSELDDVVASVRGSVANPRGSVRVACFTTLVPFLMPRLLYQLGQEYPDLEVEVTETDADSAEQLLRSGGAELAITYDFGIGDDISITEVGTARPYVVVPAGDPRAARRSIHLAELADHPLVLLDLPQSREYVLSLFRARRLEPNVTHRTGNYETARALVARNLGYSILHQRPKPSIVYDGGRVAAVEIADEIDRLPIVMARLENVRHTARAKAVESMLASLNWLTT
jgi:DNA-binding transcriptional LysR family regulator